MINEPLNEACQQLDNFLSLNYGRGSFSIGHDTKNTIFIYQHVDIGNEYQNLIKQKMNLQEFTIVYKNIGSIRLAE